MGLGVEKQMVVSTEFKAIAVCRDKTGVRQMPVKRKVKR